MTEQTKKTNQDNRVAQTKKTQKLLGKLGIRQF